MAAHGSSLFMTRTISAVLLTLLLVCAAAASVAAGKAKGGRLGRVETECRDLATPGECVARGGGGSCRWCRSEVLDDMCFETNEAWRLPQQVFSCDPPAAAAHAR